MAGNKDQKVVVQKFLSSYTYKTWQTYCKMRDNALHTFAKSGNYQVHPLNQETINKYIVPSITFRMWTAFDKYISTCREEWVVPCMDYVKSNIPQPVKHKLKHIKNLLMSPRDYIDDRIYASWNAWVDKRADNSIDIINFGVINFEYRIQRPQHLALSLAPQNRVFYIETEFLPVFSTSKVRLKVTEYSKNVFIVKLSAPANYFIYTDTTDNKGVAMLFESLKILMRKARVINPVIKVDHPFWGCVVDKLNMPIVYDVMDLHEGFEITGTTIHQKHIDVVKKANLVIASSDFLHKSLQNTARDLIMLRNAAEYQHFAGALNSIPAELKHLPGKIIGYYGAIAEWFDENILELTAQAHPNDSIVLIGRLQNDKVKRLADTYNNIHLLGEKSYMDLPQYAVNFDVCLIPFKLTPLIQATNPVKIYEYFAMGKPVVATKIPELLQYIEQMYIARNPKDFVHQVGIALLEQRSAKNRSRKRIAQANTWEKRGSVLGDKIRQLAFPKVSVVMLVYNNAKLSNNAIESVLNHSKYGNLELIIVDNNSDSKTKVMVKKYQKMKNVTIVLNRKNYGFSKGNNIGIRKATGEYIILLNNDTLVTPGWIERLVSHARDRKVGLVGPVTNSIGNESKIEIYYDALDRRDLEAAAADYTYEHWGRVIKLSNIAAFAWIMSRAVYDKVGELDERFGQGLFEDDDYCRRVLQAGYTIWCAEDSFVHHYGGASTNWGSEKYQKLFEANKKLFEEKWGVTWQSHQYRKKHT